ncbi:hypothetical protein BaRGS_00019949, partial [Batillaria attramentaria]
MSISFIISGHYLYLNTSNESVKPNDTALLVSEEKAPPTASVCLMFWYYVNGGNTSHLDVFLVDSASQTRRELWSTVGHENDSWSLATVPVVFNQTFQIVIRGVVGDDSSFEMGVDDITFVEDFNCTLTPDEAGVNATVEIDLTIDEIPEVYPEAHFGQGTGPTVWLDDVMCIGSEVELDQCRHNGWGNTDCNRSESVGVICTHGNVNPTVLTEAFFGQGDGVVLMSDLSCQGSEVTVHECPRKQQSELQCTHQEDVGVICSECNSNPVVHHGGVYGPGSGPILLDEVRCLGVELDIARCSHDPWGLTDCTHAEDVGVACPAGIHEKYLFFGSATSVVEVHAGAHFGPGSGHVLFANLECVGTETDLQQCPHKAASPIYCPHDRDVGVTCGHAECDFEHGSLCHWVNTNELGSPHPNTRLDWTVTGPASRFGPRVDHTKHNAQGHFARFRPKNNQHWTQAWLVSPSLSSPTLTGCLVFCFTVQAETTGEIVCWPYSRLISNVIICLTCRFPRADDLTGVRCDRRQAPSSPNCDIRKFNKDACIIIIDYIIICTPSVVTFHFVCPRQSLKVALVAKQNTGRGYVLVDDVSFTSGSCDGHTASSTTQKVTSQAPLMSTSTTRKPILPLHTSQLGGSTVDCDFESPNICGYQQVTSDRFDWTRHSGHTPSANTGPDADHTTGHGYYMFIETSSPRRPGDKALLATPTFNSASPTSCFTFWYSMNGGTIGTLELLTAAPDLNSHVHVVWRIAGSQGVGWHQAKINVNTSNPVRFLFRGTRGTGAYSDMAIDDVKATEGKCVLAGCDFENNTLCGWSNSRDGSDQLDWTLHEGATPSHGTGPRNDHTLNNAHGHYIYIQTPSASVRPNDSALLIAIRGVVGDKTSSDIAVDDITTENLNCQLAPTSAIVRKNAHVDLHPVASSSASNTQRTTTRSTTLKITRRPATHKVTTISTTHTTRPATHVTTTLRTSQDHTTTPLATTTAHHPHVASTPAPQTFDVRLFSSCDFETTCQSYIKGPGDFAWTTHSGPTTTHSTGPSVDHTRGTRSGHYAYTEATSHAGKTARMLTGEFPATQSDVCLKFYYHMYGRGMGTLNIKIAHGTTLHGQPLWTKSGDQGNQWHLAQVTLPASQLLQNFRIAFEGVMGRTNLETYGDIAIDDIVTVPTACPADGNCAFEMICLSWSNVGQNGQHILSDNMDWLTGDHGHGPSGGPPDDHTFNNTKGKFMYFSSTSRTQLAAVFITTAFGHSQHRCVSFWFYLASTAGRLSVGQYVSGHNTVIWNSDQHHPHTGQWVHGQATIQPKASYQVVFVATNHNGPAVVALDDIVFSSTSCLSPTTPATTTTPTTTTPTPTTTTPTPAATTTTPTTTTTTPTTTTTTPTTTTTTPTTTTLQSTTADMHAVPTVKRYRKCFLRHISAKAQACLFGLMTSCARGQRPDWTIVVITVGGTLTAIILKTANPKVRKEAFYGQGDGIVLMSDLNCQGRTPVVHHNAVYGPGSGPILLDEVRCLGVEQDIALCYHDPWGLTDCTHGEDVGVACPAGMADTFCATGSATSVVEVHAGAHFGPGSGHVLFANLECVGTETDLQQCPHKAASPIYCPHDRDVGVTCRHVVGDVGDAVVGTGGGGVGVAECDFEHGSLCHWVNSNELGSPQPNTRLDWTVTGPASRFGPRVDHTKQNAQGHFARFRPKNNQQWAQAWLVSPSLSSSTLAGCLVFWFALAPENNLNVYSMHSNDLQHSLWKAPDRSTDAKAWEKGRVPITFTRTGSHVQSLKVALVAKQNTGRGYVLLDDVSFTSGRSYCVIHDSESDVTSSVNTTNANVDVNNKETYPTVTHVAIRASNEKCVLLCSSWPDAEKLDAGSPVDCNFDLGICSYEQVRGDDFDWTRHSGRTQTPNTGPDTDHTTGHGQYMFIETSNPRGKGDEALLATPTLTWTSPTSCFTFWYNMNGAAIGTLELLTVAPDLRRNKHVLWTMSGSQGLQWHQAKITVNTISPLRFLFRGVRGDSYTGDIAIDDVKVTEGGCILADCDFENNTLCGWSNARDGSDQLDWTLHQGATSTHGTGPSTDHTLGNTHGHYIYIETSRASIRPNDSAILAFSIAIRGVVGDKGSSDMAVDDITFTKNLSFIHNPQNCDIYNTQNYNKIYDKIYNTQNYNKIYNTKTYDKIYNTQNYNEIYNETCNPPGNTYTHTSNSLFTGGSPVDCDFESPNICGYQQMKGDQFDWSRNRGPTGTANTGPAADHTSGHGYYMYIETSSPRINGDKALLATPTLNWNSPSSCFTFWYSMTGSTVGALELLTAPPDLHNNIRQVWAKSGSQGSGWHQARISVNTASPLKFLFRGTRSTSYNGDIAIDDVKASKGECSLEHTTAPLATTTAHHPHAASTPAPQTVDVRLFSSCDFENTCQSYIKGPGDFAWTTHSGPTTTGSTGPSVDHTRGTRSGHYAYTEATSHAGKTARMLTGEFPATKSDVCLQFYYHMYGRGIGTLNIKIAHGTTLHGQPLWTKSGDQGKQWHLAQVTLPASQLLHNFRIAFEGVMGRTNLESYGDIAIDDIVTVPTACPADDWSTGHHGHGPSGGPPDDHTFNNTKGKFMYFSTTSRTQHAAVLITTAFGHSQHRCVSFWFYLSSTAGRLSVGQYVSGHNTVIWSSDQHHPHTGQWVHGQATIQPKASYQVVFVATNHNGPAVVALDDIVFSNTSCSCDVEGCYCELYGRASVEGYYCELYGRASVEGYYCELYGRASVEGYYCELYGRASVEG